MTIDIITMLTILGIAVFFFVTGKLRMDLVALMVLVSLAVTGLVSPREAVSGFSNPAVITVWAVFILSGGLSRTGVAGLVGRQVLRLSGRSETGLVVMIMMTAGLMSAFMNNVGVTALLLPVVMDIARRTGRPPSKLLIPLAFSSLLGGLTTLIGTPPNILVSEALARYGLRPFSLFEFSPVGLSVMFAGIGFMVLFGRRLLPTRDLTRESSSWERSDPEGFRDLKDKLFVILLGADSDLVGKTLAESRMRTVLGFNVIGIIRVGKTQLAPDPQVVLGSGDKLLVEGRADRLTGVFDGENLALSDERLTIERLTSADIEVAEIEWVPHPNLKGGSIGEIDFRGRYGVNVLALRRQGKTRRTHLKAVSLQSGDILLVQGHRNAMERLRRAPEFIVAPSQPTEMYHLEERLMLLHVPAASSLVGRTLAESRLSERFGLTVLGILRGGVAHLMPHPQEKLSGGETLIVEGRREDLLILEGFQGLNVDTKAAPEISELETEQVGFAEVVLSPHTHSAGKTLRELHFREKYGLTVLGICREGKTRFEGLRDMALNFGDALLLYGSRNKLKVLGEEPDFLVLTQHAQEIPRSGKAPFAAAVLGVFIVTVLLGLLPVYLAAVAGAALMVLTGCLNMEEAYRAISWRAVFLIAGMLPVGMALEKTGAAQLAAQGVMAAAGGLGPMAVIAGLFLMTAFAAQIMPTAAVAILMAPIALNAASDLGLSPYALVMAVALSASASFMSPVAHPANVLIMGPGGYRFSDYIKVGLPLTLIILVVVMLVLPLFWPLTL